MADIASQAYQGKEIPIELFPRWMAQSTLFNTQVKDRNTTAYMIAGNSTLERMIGVAPEFPNKIFKRDEIATTTDVMDLLGVKQGDTIEANVSF